MSGRNNGSGFVAAIIVVGFILCVSLVMDASTPKCIKSDCDNEQAEGSNYCYLHKLYSGSSSYKSKSSGYSSSTNSSSGSSSSTKYKSSSSSKSTGTSKSLGKSNYSSNPYTSYDEGYDSVYDDEDYDWDRYYRDDDYADGVDDAMDELGW